MCGVCAIAGHGNIVPQLISSLEKLEYRGYDSCGIFVYDEHDGTLKKNIGEVRAVAESERFSAASGSIGIGHTRWATHGRVTTENAHPFYSNDQNFVIAHNGIISNHKEIRSELIEAGYTFTSETDSEVFANLVQKNYAVTHDVEKAFLQSLLRIDGHYSLVLFSKHNPEEIYAVKKDSPLIVGLGDGVNYITSDISAFLQWTRDAVTFDDQEYIVLSNHGYVAKNLDTGKTVTKKVLSVEWNSEEAQKGGFEHYMLKEIFEQPQTVRKALAIPGEHINTIAGIISETPLNYFMGVGTTYYVSQFGSYLFHKIAGLTISAFSTDEGSYLLHPDKNTHFIFISQSGETYDTRIAVKTAKKQGAKTTSIVNIVGSSISQMVDECIYQASGPEISVVSTKAALSQMIILHRLALATAYRRKRITLKDLNATEKKISNFSDTLSQAVNQESGKILHLVERYVGNADTEDTVGITNWLYLGKGVYYPIALEAALKMKEITYIHAEGMSAGFLKHGTLSLVDRKMGSFFFMPDKKDPELYDATIHAIQEVAARNGPTLCFGSKHDDALRGICDHVIELPDIEPYLYPYYELIISQLFAYYSAIKLQRNIDKPRHLAKSVTVA